MARKMYIYFYLGKYVSEACFSKVQRTFRALKANGQTATRLFWKADLLACC